MRLRYQIIFSGTDSAFQQFVINYGPRTGSGDDWLRLGGTKLFVDGRDIRVWMTVMDGKIDVAFKQPGGATGEVRRVLEDEKGLGRGCRISGRHVVNGGSVAITSVAPSHDFVLTAEADFSKVPRQQTNLAFL